jgi:hypothetical protein
VRNPSTGIERGNRSLDTSDLPLVHVEVLVNGFGREERTAATGALGELLKPRFS